MSFCIIARCFSNAWIFVPNNLHKLSLKCLIDVACLHAFLHEFISFSYSFHEFSKEFLKEL